MERFVELIRKFLEIQSDGRLRSPELVAEDDRLMDGLQKRYRDFVLRSIGEQMNNSHTLEQIKPSPSKPSRHTSQRINRRTGSNPESAGLPICRADIYEQLFRQSKRSMLCLARLAEQNRDTTANCTRGSSAQSRIVTDV
jgi:hypothetical protein